MGRESSFELEISFETSALQNLMNRAEWSREELAELVAERAVLMLSPVVPAQLFDTDSKEILEHNRERLMALGARDFFVTAPLPDMLELELAQPVARTPCPVSLADWMDGTLALSASDRRHMSNQWLVHPRMRQLDRQAHGAFCSTKEKPSLSEILDEASLEGGFFRHCLEAVSPVQFIEALLANPIRFACHIATSGMAVVNAICAYAGSVHAPAYPWLKAERDNWNDMAIVSTSAYACVLVTDDSNMRGRVEFLRSKGIAHVRPITLDDFLAGRFAPG